MRKGTLKLGVVALTALTVVAPLVATQSAYADYAPTSGDVIGVGSDTLQYMIDFLADGDAYGASGYNAAGNKNKLVDIDASADANARLAFGAEGSTGNGNGGTTGTCALGDGSTAGTGNTGGAVTPCVLNPTVVLRQGLQPIQRPNGSGAGFKALAGDVTDGTYTINFSRASATQSPAATYGSCGTVSVPCFDSIAVGSENVVMISANGATGHPSNAVPLSLAQVKEIYEADSGSCIKWNQVGGTSADTIIPIIPQSGSGTRSFFLGTLGLSNPGTCAIVGEENDPTAIGSAATPADAIEPMSQGRLNMYLGLRGDGTSGGIGGYFLDPSCPFDANTTACGTGTGASYYTNPLAPPVKVLTGTPEGGGTAYAQNRDLYIYFRNSDITSAAPFQPGGTQNWLTTLFYNPCLAGQTCPPATTNMEGQTVQYGPGGAPYIDTTSGYQDILDAGVTPVDPVLNEQPGGA